eukprot:1161665-Pelagomonas_calceolata.AAC.6
MPARGQGRHDSVEDAAVSMRLVMHELASQQRTPPMEPPEIKACDARLVRLTDHASLESHVLYSMHYFGSVLSGMCLEEQLSESRNQGA